MEENLKLSVSGETVIAALSGEIDHHRAVRVRLSIDEMLLTERPQMLVIDIGEVDFMDSSGLGLIMGRYRKASEIGTVLVVRNPSSRSEKMLKLTRLDKIIRIEPPTIGGIV